MADERSRDCDVHAVDVRNEVHQTHDAENNVARFYALRVLFHVVVS
jgi:hypothetical protein